MTTTLRASLSEILEEKREDVKELHSSGRADAYRKQAQPTQRDFAAVISKRTYGPNLIAEFKRASPSKGIINKDAEPGQTARAYQHAGASAISVLTNEYFGGTLNDMLEVRGAVSVPVLRKDFIIDSAQVYESRFFGADAILLIANLLTPSQIKEYIAIADSLKMAALVESHDEQDVEKAVKGGARLFGINSRDLHTGEIQPMNYGLLSLVADRGPVIIESGIHTGHDVERIWLPEVKAMLVGEALMTAPSIEKKVQELLSR